MIGTDKIVHQLTRVTGVGLQQNRLLMTATADAGAVGELAFGAILQGIDLYVAGQWLAERLLWVGT
jgi:hypothetical protein